MRYRRLMIAAPKSGSGKTTVTCALLQALKMSGQQVASFKCGPDYIDPMFHEKVIGVPSRNLDTFFTGKEQTKELFGRSAPEEGISVMEGVMGIFDGVGGVMEEGSSYHLAEVTKTPIVLVADAKGMGRSILPLLAGFLTYDEKKLIRGVILNRMSKGYYETIKPLIETELGLPVFGFFPEKKELCVESRHLGLMMPTELQDIQGKIQTASQEFEKNVSIEAIMEVAGSAEGLELAEAVGTGCQKKNEGYRKIQGTESLRAGEKAQDKPVIAVARDEAFCFYYADNLRMLAEYGAELKYFSPLHDTKLPKNCHALLFGGGYPELYAKKLSRNEMMHAAVRQAIERGMPVVAECGGFMYLHSAIVDKEGSRHACAGVIPAECIYTGRLVRFGYIELREKENYFLPKGECIRGHEFHYFDSTHNGEDVFAIKPMTGRKYPCILAGETYWMGFPHLYYPSNPQFAQNFVEKAERYKNKTKGEKNKERMARQDMENSYRFFENRECKYFPCHKGLSKFNCLFCYCPLYSREKCAGNPRFLEKEGRKIKDCTNCVFPHKPENYEAVVRILKRD